MGKDVTTGTVHKINKIQLFKNIFQCIFFSTRASRSISLKVVVVVLVVLVVVVLVTFCKNLKNGGTSQHR